MLDFLGGKGTGRQLPLGAHACGRRVWKGRADERSRNGLETAEPYTEGRVSAEELAKADDASQAPSVPADRLPPVRRRARHRRLRLRR